MEGQKLQTDVIEKKDKCSFITSTLKSAFVACHQMKVKSPLIHNNNKPCNAFHPERNDFKPVDQCPCTL